MRGATTVYTLSRSARGVSIHAPRAGRDDGQTRLIDRRGVSIHAPRAGRDDGLSVFAVTTVGFNPRAPCGARLDIPIDYIQSLMFQSTRPVRGATLIRSITACGLSFQSTRPVRGATSDPIQRHTRYAVSIHAPRAGRDVLPVIPPENIGCFNPRAPCGARPAIRYGRRQDSLVSIHAPRAGRDLQSAVVLIVFDVSIHAPRAGRDYLIPLFLGHICRFNPRAPCGARPRRTQKTRLWASFNPRAPCGARP